MLTVTEFLKGIILEENPYEDEQPEAVTYYDLSGNEVSIDEAE